MCDSPARNGYRGWRGWLALPAPRLEAPCGDWVDLTYPLSPDVPRVASFAPPVFMRIAEMQIDLYVGISLQKLGKQRSDFSQAE